MCCYRLLSVVLGCSEKSYVVLSCLGCFRYFNLFEFVFCSFHVVKSVLVSFFRNVCVF